MEIIFSTESWHDYLYWQRTDKKRLRKINELIREIIRMPLTGTGKPEPLKHRLQGCWSRRIDHEHRLVYEVTDDAVRIVSCRYHY